jgi:hypothetical protein
LRTYKIKLWQKDLKLQEEQHPDLIEEAVYVQMVLTQENVVMDLYRPKE